MSVYDSLKFLSLSESNSLGISVFFASFMLKSCHWPDKSRDIANSLEYREENVQSGTY